MGRGGIVLDLFYRCFVLTRHDLDSCSVSVVFGEHQISHTAYPGKMESLATPKTKIRAI